MAAPGLPARNPRNQEFQEFQRIERRLAEQRRELENMNRRMQADQRAHAAQLRERLNAIRDQRGRAEARNLRHVNNPMLMDVPPPMPANRNNGAQAPAPIPAHRVQPAPPIPPPPQAHAGRAQVPPPHAHQIAVPPVQNAARRDMNMIPG